MSEALFEYLREKLDVEVGVAIYNEGALKLMPTTGKFECFLADRRIPEAESALKLVDLVEANASFAKYTFFGPVTSRDVSAAPMIGVSGVARKTTPVQETAALISETLADPTSVPNQARSERQLGLRHALE